MCKKIIIDSILMLFLTTGVCCASECTIASEQMQNNPKTDPVDEVLEELNKRTFVDRENITELPDKT